ncbi:MAG TPA: hypothetical protein VGN97_18715 [Mesorhizobium sp.]|jgi:hypothetical protein|nr:hypothetical protein [Mesorhizobium sp.]
MFLKAIAFYVLVDEASFLTVAKAQASSGEEFHIQIVADKKLHRFIVLAQGEITDGLSERFERTFGTNINQPIIFVLVSPGGSLFEGVKLGRYIRAIGATTFIPSWGECLSACALTYFGGESRSMDKGAVLGVHRFWHLPGTLDGSDTYELVDATQELSGLIAEYIDEMGIDSRVTNLMLLTPSADMRVFSDGELAQLRIDQPLPPGVETVETNEGVVVVNERLFQKRMDECQSRGLLICPAPPGSTIKADDLPRWRMGWFSGVSDVARTYAAAKESR